MRLAPFALACINAVGGEYRFAPRWRIESTYRLSMQVFLDDGCKDCEAINAILLSLYRSCKTVIRANSYFLLSPASPLTCLICKCIIQMPQVIGSVYWRGRCSLLRETGESWKYLRRPMWENNFYNISLNVRFELPNTNIDNFGILWSWKVNFSSEHAIDIGGYTLDCFLSVNHLRLEIGVIV